MSTAALVYPHQLFESHPALDGAAEAVLVEDPLFFREVKFHKQKLMLHRAAMSSYADRLKKLGHRVRRVEAMELKHSGDIAAKLKTWKIASVRLVDPCDVWLSRRLTAALARAKIAVEVLPDPHFLTPQSEIHDFAGSKKKLFFTEFYVRQRKRLNVLIDDGKPLGGQWSFDPENRKKLPKGIVVPVLNFPAESEHVAEARRYVRMHFPTNPGDDEPFRTQIDHAGAAAWLDEFLKRRFANFGDYEDAISTKHDVIFHSLLSPLLNIGLLSPRQVLDAALEFADVVPLNSLEGFIRQVIGWREFIRLVYLKHGRGQRTANFWNATSPMPRAFYDGTSGIAPVDHVIQQVLRTSYCHHIERLMILGSFFALSDIHPDAVYRWFMELFIDAYDWVMVPNVYGMSQHADGGLMTTKPYICGSSYVLKMSDFAKGPWCPIWDALYWRFIHNHADFFAGNPRMAMMAKMKDKLGPKLQEHLRTAEAFLAKLHG